MCSGKCSAVAQHRNNDGMLQSGFISHAYQNGNNSNLKCWNISWFAITFQKRKKKEMRTHRHRHKNTILHFFFRLVLVFTCCVSARIFPLLVRILSISLSPPPSLPIPVLFIHNTNFIFRISCSSRSS